MVTPLYTKAEAAELLKVSQHTIHNLVVLGKLRSTKIGRRRFFTESHINELIENGEV